MENAALFAAGFVAWVITTFAAGGGSMLMLAAASAILSGHTIAPVVTCTSLLGGAGRIAFFWRHVDWKVVRWYVPGAAAGAAAGGWIFIRLPSGLLQWAIALFLMSTLWQYRFGERVRSFRMPLPAFVPVSFASGLTSAVVGASGVLANPFYLNYGLVKERMLATRAVNSILLQCTKLAAYAAVGALSVDLAVHGMAAGAGAVLGVWASRPWLKRLPARRFRALAVLVMFASGVALAGRLLLNPA